MIHHPEADGVILKGERVVCVFFLIFCFEVIASSHAVVRNNTERSHFPQFPPMVASCVTTIQYYSQETDIEIIH